MNLYCPLVLARCWGDLESVNKVTCALCLERAHRTQDRQVPVILRVIVKSLLCQALRRDQAGCCEDPARAATFLCHHHPSQPPLPMPGSGSVSDEDSDMQTPHCPNFCHHLGEAVG